MLTGIDHRWVLESDIFCTYLVNLTVDEGRPTRLTRPIPLTSRLPKRMRDWTLGWDVSKGDGT